MADAEVTQRRGFSPIWIVPIVAVLLGAWMVFYTWRNEGPEITVTFSTAEGIEAGKTKIKARSVEVGIVESVLLGDDLESVIVTARIERSAALLLREDTQFWVVRARIGTGGVSGLGTVLSGGYLELAPGVGDKGQRSFAGLEVPPVTPAGTPGVHLRLVSEQAGSVSAGDPIYYKGYRVGRIESTEFDVGTQEVRYSAFIDAPFDDLVTTATRFWNVSGISFSATAEGISLNTGSLQSLLFGGVAFDLPGDMEPGTPIGEGATFDLYPDLQAIDERPYHHAVEYVVEFDRSVRGLQAGAPVEYRGLPSGRVERILLDELVAANDAAGRQGQASPIPVLIRLEPGRLKFDDSPEGVADLEQAIEISVRNGLRATLATGSLITGSLYVALDIYPEEKAAEIGSFSGRPTIPTIAGGLEALEHQVAALLDKLNSLPLGDVTRSADATLRSADDTLVALRQTVEELRVLLASDGIQSLPATVETTLEELDRTLRSVNSLAQTLEEQPNALVFPRSEVKDPEPPAGTR
jgi:paraquat-inducible protein B